MSAKYEQFKEDVETVTAGQLALLKQWNYSDEAIKKMTKTTASIVISGRMDIERRNRKKNANVSRNSTSSSRI